MNKISIILIIVMIFTITTENAFAQKSIRQFLPNNLNSAWQKVSDFGKKIGEGIKNIWQAKAGNKTKEWLKNEWALIKTEFGKEVAEMKKDIIDSLRGKFNNIKVWEKILK